MYKWLWSNLYDRMMKDAENKGLREWRRTLLKNVSGEVLEFGCGTGVNLEFYPNTIKRLVLVEPNVYMCRKFKPKIPAEKSNNIEILNSKIETLLLADASFDVIVCTLVLCSVSNLEKTLSEIHRLLRPADKLIFIEHVAALNNPKRYRWQRRLEFLWKHLADGCRVTRNTAEAIANSGFKIISLECQSIRGVPAIVRPSIRGIAEKISSF